ncbi:DoxX family protein [Bowdeniella massiliensis]|uniref:DoxX family protein n=1 Tax=Bowdeniella massiliensis TaxID=2932264 RepID=UPI002028BA66|nr:DoxX family protein [Bowdeniella massiliensis]
MIIKLLARPLLAAPFIAEGIDAVRNPKKHAERFATLEKPLTQLGLPPALSSDTEMLARVLGGVSAVAGLCLATGRKPRTAALTLAAINLPLVVTSNPLWQAKSADQRKEFTANLLKGGALAGGLLYAANDRAGKPSLGWRWDNYLEHRADLKDTKQKLKARYRDDD